MPQSIANISCSFFTSSLVNVTPFPIFSCSGDQSRRSNLGAFPFQEIKFNSLCHPLGLSESTPICCLIANCISDIISPCLSADTNHSLIPTLSLLRHLLRHKHYDLILGRIPSWLREQFHRTCTIWLSFHRYSPCAFTSCRIVDFEKLLLPIN